MKKPTTRKRRLVLRDGIASAPLETIVLSLLRQRFFIADADTNTEQEQLDKAFANEWLHDFATQYVELLREKLARSKPTVTDAQIADALSEYATQEDAAVHLGISARAIRKRKSATKKTKKRNR